jgi:hypothetical protein
MLLELKRIELGTNFTIGKLFVDGVYECFTLEDKVRPEGVKKFGETAIPCGTYEVDITVSERFKKPLPELKAVPGFEGIRIHSGNTDLDTEGCILVGQQWKGGDLISQSRLAFGLLFDKLQVAKTKKEPIKITISNM